MHINHRHFPSIDSTNTWAKQHAQEFDRQAITLVTADAQTAGRGRFSRQWVSPPHQNIYATYCLFLEKHRQDIGNLPQVAAISIAQVLAALDFCPKLKWPNDVLLANKKVAGILSESTPLSDMLCLIIGIGLNVNMPAETLQAIDRPATSLCVESGHLYDIAHILELLTTQFTQNISLFLDEGFPPFLETYRRLLYIPAHSVQFNDNRTTWGGRIQSVNNDGSLNFILADNSVRVFHAGEILPD